MPTLTTETAKRLKKLKNNYSYFNNSELRIEETINFKNELKEIVYNGNNTPESFREVTFFCRKLIQEIESVEKR